MLRGSGACARGVALLLLALPLRASPPPPPSPPPSPPLCATLCLCTDSRLTCNRVPFHRFPHTKAGVRDVVVAGARLGALEAAALDGRALRSLEMPASRLHSLERRALASMALTLDSLNLGYNEFTEVPLEALRDLKVLNWLNLQNNMIADLDREAEWGSLADSLTILSLADNQLRSLGEGALSALRQLTYLHLEGNRLLEVHSGALPPSLTLLHLADNLLPSLPCAVLASLPLLSHLRLRGNALHPAEECRPPADLDLAQNELDDTFALVLPSRPPLQRLILDLNRFTAIPTWLQRGAAALEHLSLSHNRVARVSPTVAHALRSLQRLDLDHNALRSPPDALRALSALQHLNLASNELHELRQLPPHLYFLSLADNLLTSVPPALHLLAPATLLHLDLGYNLISALEPDSFGEWSEVLGRLVLRGNKLARLSATTFPPGLPLIELALSFNELTRAEAGALASLANLNILELSSTRFGGEFPAVGANSISWLSLNDGDIRRVKAADLREFPELAYLNLDFNKIIEFHSEANSSNLRELRLSYNRLDEVRSDFLRGLPELISVDLSYNRIRNVSARAFNELPALYQLSLAGNLLTHLAPCALRALPSLESLDLHGNRLTELSVASFERVSSADAELTVNASRNRIAALVSAPSASPSAPFAALVVLDLEHNRLSSLAPAFFVAVGARIRRLVLAHNRLAQLDGAALRAMPRLQLLELGAAGLPAVRRRALADTPALGMLDLASNAIRQLAVEQFYGLRHLWHLRLAGNRLRALPRDCLLGTLLEHLDLADNLLAVFPGSALEAVGFTLRSLSLARNRLEHLDSAVFRSCAELRELSLAGNRLTVLPHDALAPLAHLRALDLSSNRLKANFEELLSAAPRLRRLALAGVGLRAAPALPLPELVELELSGNHITALRVVDARHLARLRVLRLADNAFVSLCETAWAALPRLTELDVSANPIGRLEQDSFEGLPRLRSLRLDRLRQLTAVSPYAFTPLAALRTLRLGGGASAGGARLADVVTELPALEELEVEAEAEALAGRLHGVVGLRLRRVQVEGAVLRELEADAFRSLGAARALVLLSVRRTGVRRLPAGLTLPLARLPHLALDFSDNELVELEPATLRSNVTGLDRFTPKLLPGAGGLALSGNKLRCGCAVAWLGAWLRRWLAEVDSWTGAAHEAARDAVRVNVCSAGEGKDEGQQEGGGSTALIALDAEATCHAAPGGSLAVPTFLWMVLLHSVN